MSTSIVRLTGSCLEKRDYPLTATPVASNSTTGSNFSSNQPPQESSLLGRWTGPSPQIVRCQLKSNSRHPPLEKPPNSTASIQKTYCHETTQDMNKNEERRVLKNHSLLPNWFEMDKHPQEIAKPGRAYWLQKKFAATPAINETWNMTCTIAYNLTSIALTMWISWVKLQLPNPQARGLCSFLHFSQVWCISTSTGKRSLDICYVQLSAAQHNSVKPFTES